MSDPIIDMTLRRLRGTRMTTLMDGTTKISTEAVTRAVEVIEILRNERAALRAENERLREALNPFSHYCRHFNYANTKWADHETHHDRFDELSVGVFRRALAALKEPA